MDKTLPADSIQEKKIDFQSIDYQRGLIKKGTNHAHLLRACSIDDGILKLKKEARLKAITVFDEARKNLALEKFVPASGAASRMFKRIYNWIEHPAANKDEIEEFFKHVEHLACFEDWLKMADLKDIETFESGLNSKVSWLKLLVEKDALGYALKPKGLIPFHDYEGEAKTPIYEHLKEAAAYAEGKDGCNIHFTVSPNHLEGFKKEVTQLLESNEFKNHHISISYSNQLAATDTVAAQENMELVKVNGELLKRPGGHGALIHNLNDLKADMVFVKNIDNVCKAELRSTTIEYKKVIAGTLLQLRKDLSLIHSHLKKGLVDEQEIQEVRDKWKIRVPKEFKNLQQYLKRPIRVCGMVKNEGEPGGGPFWCMDPFVGESAQIVEQAQMDLTDERQRGIAKHASHFNPVDLVCYLKDFEGNPIDLTQFVDHDSYFIADKSYQGINIKALEWPGLWNGAMANWITLFVEVPIETFNPVKEFKDLLREAHVT